MRVVSWNIENLAPWLDGEPSRLATQHACMGSPAVLCLQEVRIRPQDAGRIARMRAALPGFTCHASLNHDRHNGSFRGGRAYGVARWVRDALEAVPLRFAWDSEGRVIVTGVPCRGLAIVNVYAVNGSPRPHWDAAHGGLHGTRHGFKQHFIERLGDEMQTLQEQGMELLLMGDWNVSRTGRTRPRACAPKSRMRPRGIASTRSSSRG